MQSICQSESSINETHEANNMEGQGSPIYVGDYNNNNNNNNSNNKNEEYRKRKAEFDESISDNRSKRGRGRGSRGSYRPRGRTRFAGGLSSQPYGITNQLPRVCVNPEILKILGYTNSSYSNYYPTNNRTNNNVDTIKYHNEYGFHYGFDSNGMQQTVINNNTNDHGDQNLGIQSQNENYIMFESNEREFTQNQYHVNYQNTLDSPYKTTNLQQLPWVVLNGGERNQNMQNTIFVNEASNSNQQTCENIDTEQLTDDQKSLLDISNPNYHRLVELDPYLKDYQGSMNYPGNYNNNQPKLDPDIKYNNIYEGDNVAYSNQNQYDDPNRMKKFYENDMFYNRTFDNSTTQSNNKGYLKQTTCYQNPYSLLPPVSTVLEDKKEGVIYLNNDCLKSNDINEHQKISNSNCNISLDRIQSKTQVDKTDLDCQIDKSINNQDLSNDYIFDVSNN